MSFDRFFNYIRLLIDGDKKQKILFLFHLITLKRKSSFSFEDLIGYYADVRDANYNINASDNFVGDDYARGWAISVYELMGRNFIDEITFDNFEKFLTKDESNVHLFDFLVTEKPNIFSRRIKKNLLTIDNHLSNLENRIENLQAHITGKTPDFTTDAASAIAKKFKEVMNSKINSGLLPKTSFSYVRGDTYQRDFLKNVMAKSSRPYLEPFAPISKQLNSHFNNLNNQTSLKTDFHEEFPKPILLLNSQKNVDSVSQNVAQSNYNIGSKQSIDNMKPTFVASSLPFDVFHNKNEATNFNHHISSMEKFNFKLEGDMDEELQPPTAVPFGVRDRSIIMMDIIEGMKSEVRMIRQILNSEIEVIDKADTQQETLTKDLRYVDASNASQRMVYFNDKNWNLVTTMVSGIQKSLNIVAGESYHVLSKNDFKFHNKIQIDSIYSSSFQKCKFKDYMPYVFQNIRRRYGITHESYLASLGVNTFKKGFFENLYLMVSQQSSGKSGSFFFYSADQKYLIKTIRRVEFELLQNFLKHYHDHFNRFPKTLINRFFGLHELKCYNKDDVVNFDIFVIVMNNVLEAGAADIVRYDLKGSSNGREIDKGVSVSPQMARKDLDAVRENFAFDLPLETKISFLNQIREDAMFLAKHSLIDYSLLVGVTAAADSPKAKYKSTDGMYAYNVGIIDILTPFDLKKKGEYVLRKVTQGSGFSCIPPEDYCERFIKMAEYFCDWNQS